LSRDNLEQITFETELNWVGVSLKMLLDVIFWMPAGFRAMLAGRVDDRIECIAPRM
jgi:hypothetical protein